MFAMVSNSKAPMAEPPAKRPKVDDSPAKAPSGQTKVASGLAVPKQAQPVQPVNKTVPPALPKQLALAAGPTPVVPEDLQACCDRFAA